MYAYNFLSKSIAVHLISLIRNLKRKYGVSKDEPYPHFNQLHANMITILFVGITCNINIMLYSLFKINVTQFLHM